MPTNPTNPTWIEPPPKTEGMGCAAKGCLAFVIASTLLILLLFVGSYFFVSRGLVSQKPTEMPVKELSSQQLADLNDRIDHFKATVPSYTPTPGPAANPEESPTPAPATGEEPTGRELVMSADEINGLISANPKSRGHAFVSLSGNKATVQVSIPTDKMRNLPQGYVNGSFVVTTDGPTPLTGIQVSKIQAGGLPVPSNVLSTTYRGNSVLGLALDAAAPYNVNTVEIRNGTVIVR